MTATAEDQQQNATIDLDGLRARAEYVGTDLQPWEPHASAYKYRVVVTTESERYECEAWGSQMDRAEHRFDAQGIAVIVLGELLSAAYDPDEFWQMAFGYGEPGKAPERETVRKVERVLDAADAMYAILDRNASAIASLEDSA